MPKTQLTQLFANTGVPGSDVDNQTVCGDLNVVVEACISHVKCRAVEYSHGSGCGKLKARGEPRIAMAGLSTIVLTDESDRTSVYVAQYSENCTEPCRDGPAAHKNVSAVNGSMSGGT